RRSGGGNRPAPRNGSGRPGPRTAGGGRRPANPRLLRQRLFVFVVVTLLVALGIAVAQGCQGPARGLGGDDGREQRHAQPDYRPADADRPMSDQHEPTLSRDFGN
ncbi:serine/threonine protein kinase, partial [Streptomyces sp. NPDC001135]